MGLMSLALRAIEWADGDVQGRRLEHDDVEVPWQLYDGSGTQIRVHYATNATWEFVRLEVDENNDAVRLTVVERTLSSKLPGTTRTATAELSDPLGDRQVIDGVSGRRRPMLDQTDPLCPVVCCLLWGIASGDYDAVNAARALGRISAEEPSAPPALAPFAEIRARIRHSHGDAERLAVVAVDAQVVARALLERRA